jgi:hypothetical protein
VKTFVSVMAILICVITGCASVALEASNEKFDKQKRPLTIQKQSIKSNIYSYNSVKYYEIPFKEESFYVKTGESDNLYLIDKSPSEKELIGETLIYVVSEDTFDKNNIKNNKTALPKEVFIVIPKDGDTLSSKSDYNIYYNINNQLHKKDRAINSLSPTATHNVISALRNTGYLITIPIDLITLPLLIGLLLII